MPAQKTRIQKPTASSASPAMSKIAAPMQLLPTKTGATPTRSPARSPAKQQAIAARRREALVEDLEQEIATRVEALRSEYTNHAKNMRAKLELRIKRIPVAMRKMTVGELLEQHLGREAAQKVASPNKIVSRVPQARSSPAKALTALKPATYGTKRTSAIFDNDEDPNNENDTISSVLNPKKRIRTIAPPVSSTTTNITNPTTTQPHQAQTLPPPSQILSPRSNNPRALPPSPTKLLISPLKPQGARPMSPTKPSVTLTTTAASRARAAEKALAPAPLKPKMAPSSRPGSRATQARPKRGAVASSEGDMGHGRESVGSEASSSAGTIVVTTGAKGRGVPGTAAKKAGPVGKNAGGTVRGKKAAAVVKNEVVPVTVEAGSGRTLRKRG